MKVETLLKRAHIAAENAQKIALDLRDSDCDAWAEAAKAAAERAAACDDSEREYIAKLARFAKACEDIVKATAE